MLQCVWRDHDLERALVAWGFCCHAWSRLGNRGQASIPDVCKAHATGERTITSGRQSRAEKEDV